MATIQSIDEHFSAQLIGKALATLYGVDGLTLGLQIHVDEEGHPAKCPITLAPISRNAGMIHDGTVYQYGYIRQWLAGNNRSPLTNCVLPHRMILRLSPLADVIETFLQECFQDRTQSWQQRLAKAANTDRNSSEDLENALLEIEGYMSSARRELSNWLQHVRELEDHAAALQRDLMRCRRTQARALSRLCTDSVLTSARRRVCAAVVIQSSFRKLLTQRRMQRKSAAVVCIQRCARSFLAQVAAASVHAASIQHSSNRSSRQLTRAIENHLNPAVVQALLDKGALANTVDEFGYTPLHLAAQKGNSKVVQLLCEARADMNKLLDCSSYPKCCQHRSNGATPLFLAGQHGQIEVTKLLCKAGADISIPYLEHNMRVSGVSTFVTWEKMQRRKELRAKLQAMAADACVAKRWDSAFAMALMVEESFDRDVKLFESRLLAHQVLGSKSDVVKSRREEMSFLQSHLDVLKSERQENCCNLQHIMDQREAAAEAGSAAQEAEAAQQARKESEEELAELEKLVQQALKSNAGAPN